MNRSDIDKQHIWHPYSAMDSSLPVFQVDSAKGVYLQLDDGRKLIDGMSSWWCMIHGYNHPDLNQAATSQLHSMSHVMFGGLTHEPAIHLTEKLLSVLPQGLDKVFYADSGSVSVEIAMKMAIQYWQAKQKPDKHKFIALRSGYHGDTFAAMSVCDPVTGMHTLFTNSIIQQVFAEQPRARFNENCHQNEINQLEETIKSHADSVAAFILEPVVQGAGGMWFYSPEYLSQVRLLCDKYGILLIADEIATGFGRTGKLFACEYAGITPDIMCIGKALTGGYMTLAATITSQLVAETIDHGEPGVFMHGPTFMANPLACAVALKSIELLLESDWQQNITRIESILSKQLAPCDAFDHVNDVRVLGAIGVIEMKQAVNMHSITKAFVNEGVWVRPFGKLVYLMPPYIISDDELISLTQSVVKVVKAHQF